jgi:hypothetical protein
MLIQSSSASLLDGSYSDEEHSFMMKSLLLCGKFDHAYLYVLKHHSNDTFADFLKWATINGNLAELVQFKRDRKLLEQDER